MSIPAISFKNLTKIYTYGFWGQKQTALNNLNSDVPQNSIYGFLGANGAGKTTSIKLLLGLQFATKGSVEIFGQDPKNASVKAKIGFMPERPYLQESLTADEFLNFHRNLFGNLLTGKKLPSNSELLELVGLSGVQGKYLKDFSKGMLQRAGIAQALVNDPDLVILDEPMSGLDPVGRKEIRDLIVRLSKLGKTVFFSSHILSDIESICHRVAFLEKGFLKKEGSVKEMIANQSPEMEVLFSIGSRDELSKNTLLSSSQSIGEFFQIKCKNHEEGQRVLMEIWSKNGKVISFQPIHRSLEDILFGSVS